MFCGPRVDAASDEHGGDNAHRLLRVRPAVPQAVERSRKQLPSAKEPIHAAGRMAPEYPGYCDHECHAQDHSEQRRDENERDGFYPSLRFQYSGDPAIRHYSRARVTADERMRRAGRKPEIPGDDVPNDGADEPAE